ncbi:TPA: ABC transporter permease [bacterium]|nr:ABC transporter permease [bacterium]
MSKIWGIIKKELDKVIKNPRMFFSTFILPGLIIGGIYSFMGISLDSESGKIQEHKSVVYLVRTSDQFNEFINLSRNETYIDLRIDNTILTEEEIKTRIFEDDVDLYIVGEFIDSKEHFTLYFNQLDNLSATAYEKVKVLLEKYHDLLLEDKYGDINLINTTPKPIGDKKKETGIGLAMLLPMIVMTIVFSSSLGIGADVIAGEKERGTLSTLLMAPITKTEIIVGKILATTIITLLSSVGSFLGIAASLPFATKIFNVSGPITYSVMDYVGILFILLSVAMMAVCLVLFASTLARTTKEASMYAMPIYIVAILASTVSMFSTDLPKEFYYYLIPIYNSVLGLKGILSFSIELYQLILIFSSTIVYFILFSFVLVRLFHSEKILFSK